jgi:hypothetical protein
MCEIDAEKMLTGDPGELYVNKQALKVTREGFLFFFFKE